MYKQLFAIGLCLVLELTNVDASLSYGSECNFLDGCQSESLNCYKNRCFCAPGYNVSGNKCVAFQCSNNDECKTSFDPYRTCTNKECSTCENGTYLDRGKNRCLSMLGMDCLSNLDCNNNMDPLMCYNGQCICLPNYYPDQFKRRCEPTPQNCKTDKDCNLYGFDQNMICDLDGDHYCHCSFGFSENIFRNRCVRVRNYSNILFTPFVLIIILVSFIMTVYMGNRMLKIFKTQRTMMNAQQYRAPRIMTISGNEQTSTPKVLEKPPEYDVAVNQLSPPSYTSNNSA